MLGLNTRTVTEQIAHLPYVRAAVANTTHELRSVVVCCGFQLMPSSPFGAQLTWVLGRAASGHVGDVPLRQVVGEQLPQDLVLRVGCLACQCATQSSSRSCVQAELIGIGSGKGILMTGEIN